MPRQMRTTINLPDELILRAKKAAVEADTTLTEIIANALRESLSRTRRKGPGKEFKVIAYGKGGVFPGVDLDDTSALLDLMDGINDPHRR
jgi:glutamine synthetase adenylyltransferase